MTTTTAPAPDTTEWAPLVPEGRDAVDALTVRELDIVSSGLRADVSACLADEGAGAGKRWACLARVAYCWSKRSGAGHKLDVFLDLEATELLRLLRLDTDPAEAPGADEVAAPTDEVAANPTAPAPGS